MVDAVSLDAQGIARIAAAEPDVILVDLGQTDAVTAARLMRGACPDTKLVAFALDEIDTGVFACAAAGFSSYVPRESSAEELLRALVDAMDGRMRCAPHIAAAMFRRLADFLREARPQASLPPLTVRESEILALAEEGRSNKEIARDLTISCATVKNHMHNILQKLQVSRRGQAVARLRSCRGFSVLGLRTRQSTAASVVPGGSLKRYPSRRASESPSAVLKPQRKETCIRAAGP